MTHFFLRFFAGEVELAAFDFCFRFCGDEWESAVFLCEDDAPDEESIDRRRQPVLQVSLTRRRQTVLQVSLTRRRQTVLQVSVAFPMKCRASWTSASE